MDKANKYENRALTKASKSSEYSAHLPTLQLKSFSEGENIRVELHAAEPNYEREKTYAGSAPLADQGDPNTTPPPANEIWDLKGYHGGHGYVILDQDEDVDVELWVKDDQNNKWFRAATAISVPSYEEFRFPEAVRGRSVWLRLTNIGTTIEDITLRFSPE